MNDFWGVIERNRTRYCLDCGKCSSVCPVTLHLVEGYSSPRLLVEVALAAGMDDAVKDRLLWSCLTCQRCSELCPSDVKFTDFVRETRQLAANQGLSGPCTHGGLVQSWMKLMMDPGLEQNRLEWIEDGLEISGDSDTIYFPGCLPYFEIAFKELDVEGLEIARSALRILNGLGIAPQVLADERCCGHDLFWQGEQEGFRQLAKLNLEEFARSGAARIITTCPECAYTIKETYRQEVGDPGLEVFHLTEFLSLQGSLAGGNHSSLDKRQVTFQDPCRLGRFRGIYQQPRTLLRELGCDVVEMEHSQQESMCCGTSCWASCGQVSKRIQNDRLQEARTSGAEVLITACPKCQIHLKCAQKDPVRGEEISIPIRDIATLLAEII